MWCFPWISSCWDKKLPSVVLHRNLRLESKWDEFFNRIKLIWVYQGSSKCAVPPAMPAARCLLKMKICRLHFRPINLTLVLRTSLCVSLCPWGGGDDYQHLRTSGLLDLYHRAIHGERVGVGKVTFSASSLRRNGVGYLSLKPHSMWCNKIHYDPSNKLSLQ